MTTRPAGSIVRFAVHNRLVGTTAHPRLFAPNRELKLSVFYVDGLASADIENLGVRVVRGHSSAQRLYGWADLRESSVLDAGLQVDRDDDQPGLANIVGWPRIPSERMERMQRLAHMATSVTLDPPVEVP